MISECRDYFSKKRNLFVEALSEQTRHQLQRLTDENQTLENSGLTPLDIATLPWYLSYKLSLETSHGLTHAIFGMKLLMSIFVDFGILQQNTPLLITMLTNPIVNLCLNQDYKKVRKTAIKLAESRKYLVWLKRNSLYDVYILLKNRHWVDAVKTLASQADFFNGNTFKMFCLANADTRNFYVTCVAALLQKLRIIKNLGKPGCAEMLHPKGSNEKIQKDFETLTVFLEKFSNFISVACKLKPGQYLTSQQVQEFLQIHEKEFLKLVQLITSVDLQMKVQ